MLSERYRTAGLDAVCRAYRGNAPVPKYHLPDGFLDAHRGAGMIACYRLFAEDLIEAGAAPAITAMLEAEWAGNAKFSALFAPFPAEPAAADAVPELARAFAGTLGIATGNPHSAIFPSLVMREFAARPELATPGRLEGLRRMVELETADPPEPLLPALPHEGAPFDAAALSDEALREFAHSLTSFPGYDTSYSGHILTWALAIIDLHRCGQAPLGRLAERSWRNYLRRVHDGSPDPFKHGKAREAPPAEEPWPERARFWNARPAGNLENSWAHLPKYAHAMLALTRLARDTAAASQARSLYHLMVY